MITKEEIIKMAKHIVRRGKGMHDHRLIHPQRDWSIAMVLISIGFAASTIYAGYVFQAYLNDDIENVPTDTTVVIYEQEKASRVFDIYKARTAQFTLLREDQRIDVVVSTTTAALVDEEPIISSEEDIPTEEPESEPESEDDSDTAEIFLAD